MNDKVSKIEDARFIGYLSHKIRPYMTPFQEKGTFTQAMLRILHSILTEHCFKVSFSFETFSPALVTVTSPEAIFCPHCAFDKKNSLSDSRGIGK